MKKYIYAILLIILSLSVSAASWFGPDTPPPLTRAALNQVYCQIGGNCSFDILNVTILNVNISNSGYVNMSGDIDMNNYSINEISSLNFNLSTGQTPAEGKMYWNSDDGTLNLGMPGGNVNMQIGQEIFIPRAKAIGSNIVNGQLVYVSGADGTNPEMSIAQADNKISARGTIAMATEDISENQLGYFTAFGLVRDIDTSNFTEGDMLYLSPTVPGGYTNIHPDAPYYAIKVGYVIRAHSTEGIVFVTINQRTNNYRNIKDLIPGSLIFGDEYGFLAENNSNLNWNFTTNKFFINGELNVTGEIRGGFIDRYDSGIFNGSLYTNGANSLNSNSNSIFQIINDQYNTTAFQIQSGGLGQANLIVRSTIVVNQNNTLLNSSQNNLCSDWGFDLIDCLTSTTGADLGISDDLQVNGIIHAVKGLRGHTNNYGAYLNLRDIEPVIIYNNGTFNHTTTYFCDYINNPFYENITGWIEITSQNEYEGAFADIQSYINSSCISLENNPSWKNDITEYQKFRITQDPIFIVTKGGLASFYVGNDSDSEFEIENLNANSPRTLNIKTITNIDNVAGIENIIDIKNHTGINLARALMYSSVGTNNSHNDLFDYLVDTSETSNSQYHFLDLNRIGNGGTNQVDAIHLHGDFDNIIQAGTNDFLNSSFYESTDITSNVSISGNSVTVFLLDNDFLYIGSETNFTVIGFSLLTQSSHNLGFSYYYCNSSGEWETLLGVTDTTDGFKSSGKLQFTNPLNRGTCNKEFDGTPFSNINNFTYIAIQRTTNNVVIYPVLDEIVISGSTNSFILREDIIKLAPVSTAPEICNAEWEGSIYYDIDIGIHCACNGNNWVRMTDYSTICT